MKFLSDPSRTRATYNHPFPNIAHLTKPVHAVVSGNHHEHISFHIINSLQLPVTLGYPWLCRHRPRIDWITGAISSWSSQSLSLCLKSAPSDVSQKKRHPAGSYPDMDSVPSQDHDLRGVFNKAEDLLYSQGPDSLPKEEQST